MVLWGIGRAAQDSIIKAALVDLIPHERRAYGFGVFSLAFGIFWFIGSAAMGVLYDQGVALVVAFSLVTSIVALPVFWIAKRAPAPA